MIGAQVKINFDPFNYYGKLSDIILLKQIEDEKKVIEILQKKINLKLNSCKNCAEKKNNN